MGDEMEDSSNRMLNTCRHLVIWLTIIGGLIVWILLPDQVPIHFNLTFSADRYGSKLWSLGLLLLPLCGYIPLSIPEYHLDSRENRLAISKKKKTNAFIQLIIAVTEAVIVWFILLASF